MYEIGDVVKFKKTGKNKNNEFGFGVIIRKDKKVMEIFNKELLKTTRKQYTVYVIKTNEEQVYQHDGKKYRIKNLTYISRNISTSKNPILFKVNENYKLNV